MCFFVSNITQVPIIQRLVQTASVSFIKTGRINVFMKNKSYYEVMGAEVLSHAALELVIRRGSLDVITVSITSFLLDTLNWLKI